MFIGFICNPVRCHHWGSWSWLRGGGAVLVFLLFLLSPKYLHSFSLNHNMFSFHYIPYLILSYLLSLFSISYLLVILVKTGNLVYSEYLEKGVMISPGFLPSSSKS